MSLINNLSFSFLLLLSMLSLFFVSVGVSVIGVVLDMCGAIEEQQAVIVLLFPLSTLVSSRDD